MDAENRTGEIKGLHTRDTYIPGRTYRQRGISTQERRKLAHARLDGAGRRWKGESSPTLPNFSYRWEAKYARGDARDGTTAPYADDAHQRNQPSSHRGIAEPSSPVAGGHKDSTLLKTDARQMRTERRNAEFRP